MDVIEIAGKLILFLGRLFLDMFLWIKISTSGYWAAVVLLAFGIGVTIFWYNTNGSPWALTWLAALAVLAGAVVFTGIRTWLLAGRRAD